MGSVEDSSSPSFLISTGALHENVECEEAKEDHDNPKKTLAHVPPRCAWDVPLTYHREPSTPLFFPRFKHVISMLYYSTKYASSKSLLFIYAYIMF